MSKIFLYWYKNDKLGKNFGDELGHYIISKISGLPVCHVPIPASRARMLVRGLRSLLAGRMPWRDIPAWASSMVNGNYIISIGSILGWCSGKNATVWGSGILKRTDEIYPSKFLAVRGKYTQKRLRELNLVPPDVLGDPALLLPLLLPPRAGKKYTLGIIAHYSHNRALEPYAQFAGVKIINLLNDIEIVVEDIQNCEYTISTSLHGIIVSQAYGIPSLWYTIEGIPLGGDNVKFLDYFSSVDIEEYPPLAMPSPDKFEMATLLKQFTDYEEHGHIRANLADLQSKLLTAAPFPVLPTFFPKP